MREKWISYHEMKVCRNGERFDRSEESHQTIIEEGKSFRGVYFGEQA